jgi:hypothetical protein
MLGLVKQVCLLFQQGLDEVYYGDDGVLSPTPIPASLRRGEEDTSYCYCLSPTEHGQRPQSSRLPTGLGEVLIEITSLE